ncbi:uncharacterized protein P174DRAFT_445155 [Aspergillus novofumigatus IBT 16806]|uniref:Uncharacterized protein n=1 Tax=Aspergillus novofumigatus (strain IBT 16806) TaxID=1392255 RepID=A0A2I1BXW4_ASPN1|nr:uncharacterized protein P174DRAFT_445155 [Aspergillus novofumigatus IBT 16806]PKX90218.1 hypothetical protein P174DRAFT_445155 [Aspergillus novofumigatus IBT 16806]
MTDMNNEILHANRFASEVAINAVAPSTFLILNLCSPAHLILPGFHHMACTHVDRWI